MRVRRLGKSYAHPLVVLIKHPNDLDKIRIGIAGGRSIGNAVQRNMSKRWLREVIRPLIPEIKNGWDIILLARKPLLEANFEELSTSVYNILIRSNLLK
jgi:ribonuclease P protein component